MAQATKMQAVGQLAGGIAHDFNNILTAILGLCDQLLARHTVGTPDYDDIEQVRQNGNRAANLVRQLLAFARQQTLRPQVLDVAGVIDGLQPLLKRLLGPDVDLIVINHGGAAAVRADPGQLEQVLVNLSLNARDAMSARGRPTIAIRGVPAAEVSALGHRIIPTVNLVAIAVSDTGTGIAPAIAAKIFEPFFTTKPVGQGTELRLSIVLWHRQADWRFCLRGSGSRRRNVLCRLSARKCRATATATAAAACGPAARAARARCDRFAGRGRPRGPHCRRPRVETPRFDRRRRRRASDDGA